MKARRFVFASLAFLYAFFTGTATAQQCSHVNGSWNDTNGYQWWLVPSGPNSSWGDVAQSECYPYLPWDAGTSTTGGFVSLSASNPYPSEFCSDWFEYDGAIQRGGCRVITGTWNNYWGNYGEFEMTKTCDVPGGETTQENGGGWYQGSFYTFGVNVSNAGAGNLSGRFHRETDYYQAVDECWFEGTDPDWKVTGSSGSVWILNSDNYFEDTIGLPDNYITHYRDNGRAPCNVYVFQRMQISCGTELFGSPWENVQSQVLWVEVGTTTIKNARGSVVKSGIYP
jgi:hypothetical protein